MLHKLGSDALACYERAARCRLQAERASDLFTRSDFVDMEERWLRLAKSYEFTRNLADFIDTMPDPVARTSTLATAGARDD